MAATVFEHTARLVVGALQQQAGQEDSAAAAAATTMTIDNNDGDHSSSKNSMMMVMRGSLPEEHQHLHSRGEYEEEQDDRFMACDFYGKKAPATTALFIRPSCMNEEEELSDNGCHHSVSSNKAPEAMEISSCSSCSSSSCFDPFHQLHRDQQHHYGAAFESLPEELVCLILSFLHGSHLCNTVQKVCRSWRRLALDDQLWLEMLRKTLAFGQALRKPTGKSWKWLYQSRHLIITDTSRIGDRCMVGRHENADYIYEGEWLRGKHHGQGIKLWKNIKSEREAKEQNDSNALAEENEAADGAATATANQQQALPKRSSSSRPSKQPLLPYYEGEWQDGKEHGRGKRLFEEDHYYEGEWRAGEREGYGFYHWPNKTHYEGEFKEGFRHGQGTYVWSEKAKYVGQWQKGIEHGKGTRTWADGDRYEGDWVQGTRTGYGVYSWPNGSSYEGKWFQCAHEGYGVYRWPDGRVYNGHFSANKKHGFGEYVWPDGARFSGNWRNGVRHGDGFMLWPDGTRFQGEWDYDRRARGRYFGANGSEVPHTIGVSWAKKYDYYFAMPMDMWEQIYLPEINKLICERKQREEVARAAAELVHKTNEEHNRHTRVANNHIVLRS
jgi:hypothetical protein